MRVSVPQGIASVGLVGMFLHEASMAAWAHHPMGGQMSATFAQGLLSGLGHPIIGVDHFLFIAGVGILAGLLGRRFLFPIALIVGSWAGAAVHLLGLNIPFAEAGVIASVVLMAIAIIGGLQMPALTAAGLVAAAGIFHGYAYAESIFGAEPTPLYAYLAGFAIIQFVIAVAAASLFTVLQQRSQNLAHNYARIAGGAMAGVAMVATSNMIFGL